MSTVHRYRVGLIAFIAVAAGLLAAWSAREHLRERAALLDAQSQAARHTVTVARLVAAYDLPAGSRLHADHVAIRDLPVDYAASDTLAPERFGDIDGTVLNQPLRRGDAIVVAHVRHVAQTFSARLETGHRAVTIPVDELNALSGMLVPGDFIDLYVSFDHNGRLTSALLLQGVRVLATGRQALGDGERDHDRNERVRYSAITLDVATEDAAKLVVARQTGRITAMLRHPEDTQSLRVAAHDDLAALLGITRAPRLQSSVPVRVAPSAVLSPQLTSVPATPAPIPVIYGDQPLSRVPDLRRRKPHSPTRSSNVAPSKSVLLESDMSDAESRAWLASVYGQSNEQSSVPNIENRGDLP